MGKYFIVILWKLGERRRGDDFILQICYALSVMAAATATAATTARTKCPEKTQTHEAKRTENKMRIQKHVYTSNIIIMILSQDTRDVSAVCGCLKSKSDIVLHRYVYQRAIECVSVERDSCWHAPVRKRHTKFVELFIIDANRTRKRQISDIFHVIPGAFHFQQTPAGREDAEKWILVADACLVCAASLVKVEHSNRLPESYCFVWHQTCRIHFGLWHNAKVNKCTYAFGLCVPFDSCVGEKRICVDIRIFTLLSTNSPTPPVLCVRVYFRAIYECLSCRVGQFRHAVCSGSLSQTRDNNFSFASIACSSHIKLKNW